MPIHSPLFHIFFIYVQNTTFLRLSCGLKSTRLLIDCKFALDQHKRCTVNVHKNNLLIVAVLVVAGCGLEPGPEIQAPPLTTARDGLPEEFVSGSTYVEWPTYSGNLAAQRYSELEQINHDNVGDLRITWRWYTTNFGPYQERRNQNTPLMIANPSL